jgi:hypothetical protein
MLNWLRNKLKQRQSLVLQDVMSPTVQEDTRMKEQSKRVNKAFEQQQEAMSIRAMVRHSFDCPDPLTCTKENCWVWEPDKIVGEYIVPLKTKEKRAFDQRAYEINGRRDEDDRKLFEIFNELKNKPKQ